MTEVTKISSKGQVVIPYEIRRELGLDIGTAIAVSKIDDFVIMKKINVPDLKKEFKTLTKWGSVFAKKKGIKTEEDVVRMIHKARGM